MSLPSCFESHYAELHKPINTCWVGAIGLNKQKGAEAPFFVSVQAFNSFWPDG